MRKRKSARCPNHHLAKMIITNLNANHVTVVAATQTDAVVMKATYDGLLREEAARILLASLAVILIWVV